MENLKDIAVDVYDLQHDDIYLLQTSRAVRGGIVISYQEFHKNQASEYAKDSARRYHTNFYENMDAKRYTDYQPLAYSKRIFRMQDHEIYNYACEDSVGQAFLDEFRLYISDYPL